MGRKFILFEDNEDGTTTITISLGGEEQKFIMPIGIDDFESLVSPEAQAESEAAVISNMIHIPNDLDG